MTPNAEKELMAHCQNLCAAIADHNSVSAYPALNPMVMNIAINVENMARQAIIKSREEILYGTSIGAKVYEMLTGKRLAIPKGIVSSGVNETVVSTYIPLKDICDYMLSQRPERPKNIAVTVEGGVLNFNTETKQATITFVDSDIHVDIVDVTSSKCLVDCKLFEGPYEMILDKAWVGDNLHNALYKALVKDEHLESFEEKYLIMDHFFGTREERKEVADDHPVRQLMKLLSNHEYGNNNDSYVDVILPIGYRLRMDTVQDWGHWSETRILKICSVSKVREDGNFASLYQWYRNPLLVRDIVASLDQMVNDLMDKHHAMKAEQVEE
ncbi:hypothetical protein D9M68_19840 [compost metagenome]